ncbi:MAG: metalloregulator ArsR/SmtB family transcription factor [Clostridia bacterium]|nr:metalloregulator ArsR/SmtB family transcription factor [Clostridia bacterium]
MNKLLNTLKSLSDETRLRIINILYEKEELCVCDIMEALGITQAKASRHLAYLKNAGLVSDRKHAQWVYYSLVRQKDMKFIDALVLENLRNIEQFKKDNESLGEWLAKKQDACK